MIIVMRQGAGDREVENVCTAVREWGLTPQVSRGTERTIIGVIGNEDEIRQKPLDVFPGVEKVMSVVKPYRLASLASNPRGTQVVIPPVRADGEPVVIGGPKVAPASSTSPLRSGRPA